MKRKIITLIVSTSVIASLFAGCNFNFSGQDEEVKPSISELVGAADGIKVASKDEPVEPVEPDEPNEPDEPEVPEIPENDSGIDPIADMLDPDEDEDMVAFVTVYEDGSYDFTNPSLTGRKDDYFDCDQVLVVYLDNHSLLASDYLTFLEDHGWSYDDTYSYYDEEAEEMLEYFTNDDNEGCYIIYDTYSYNETLGLSICDLYVDMVYGYEDGTVDLSDFDNLYVYGLKIGAPEEMIEEIYGEPIETSTQQGVTTYSYLITHWDPDIGLPFQWVEFACVDGIFVGAKTTVMN